MKRSVSELNTRPSRSEDLLDMFPSHRVAPSSFTGCACVDTEGDSVAFIVSFRRRFDIFPVSFRLPFLDLDLYFFSRLLFPPRFQSILLLHKHK